MVSESTDWEKENNCSYGYDDCDIFSNCNGVSGRVCVSRIFLQKVRNAFWFFHRCDYRLIGSVWNVSFPGRKYSTDYCRTAHIFEGKLYIQTGKVKPTSKQLAANPQVLYFRNAVATISSFTEPEEVIEF